VEAGDYTVTPVLGADYVSVPALRTLQVLAQGVIYSTDQTTAPLDFVLSAINGTIRGTVSKTTAGNLISTGAVVIASTYNGPFPTSLPSPLLGSAYTYSTVTLTDGSYILKVATAVNNYYLYAFVMKDGALSQYGPSAPVPVTAGGISTLDIVIP
jgi:hypothetical protein